MRILKWFLVAGSLSVGLVANSYAACGFNCLKKSTSNAVKQVDKAGADAYEGVSKVNPLNMRNWSAGKPSESTIMPVDITPERNLEIERQQKQAHEEYAIRKKNERIRYETALRDQKREEEKERYNQALREQRRQNEIQQAAQQRNRQQQNDALRNIEVSRRYISQPVRTQEMAGAEDDLARILREMGK